MKVLVLTTTLAVVALVAVYAPLVASAYLVTVLDSCPSNLLECGK